jgi:predicted MFS family arabinose efflux permease
MLWKNRTFMRMFTAYGLSTLGDWFDFIAVSILLGFVWKAEPMTIALLPLMYAGPGILFGQFAGIYADRSNKLRLMILTDIIRAVLTGLLLLAPNPAWLLLLLCLRSSVRVFHTPAQEALTRQVVPADQLFKATTMNGTVFQLGKVLGPLLGGTLAASVSPFICLMVNACSFAVSAILLTSIGSVGETHDHGARKQQKQSFREVWKEGWLVILRNRLLLASTLFSLIGLMAIQLVDAQFSVLFREKAPNHPEIMGWTLSAIGIGALLTVAGLNRLSEIRSYGWLLGGGLLLIGLMFGWLGTFQPGSGFHWLLVASFVGGIGTGLSAVASNFLRQKETPKEAIGRVTGIMESLSSGAFIIAPLIGGVCITLFGVSLTFQTIGFITAAIGAIGILLQSVIWGRQPDAVKDVRASA